MRRPLLILLSLLVLLMQPAALLHALSHGHGGQAAARLAATESAAQAADSHAAPGGLDCLQCLAFAALGSAALPGLLLAWRAPALRHAAPSTVGARLRGGSGAGYHARGPPLLA
jgi:hypothetical protein